MGYWSFYFLAKLALHGAGAIGLHGLWNLAFALALCLPQPPGWAWRLRPLWAWPAALALLWHDAYWPPITRLIQQGTQLSQFSPAYLSELMERVVSWPMMAALLLGAAVHAVANRYLRLGVVAIAGLLVATLLSGLAVDGAGPGSEALAQAAPAADPVTPATGRLSSAELTTQLQQFYDAQAAQSVLLPETGGQPPAFDLVFLSICSLAWDDLRVAGLDESLLLGRFDLVFRQFNSAATYSGPAVLRLLHAGCGQVPEHALYEPDSARCYLFQRLNQAGWRSSLLLNHDGHFDGFADQLRREGGMGLQPLDPRGAPIAMRSFDGSPVYDDRALLTRWWQQQVLSRSAKDGNAPARPVALLYNTISLHDGNRSAALGSTSSLQTWKPRAQKLFADFEAFFRLIEDSGRPTVVVLVPEHGAGLRGDAVQIRGLREYPTPRITQVPAGVALFGFGPRPAGQGPLSVDRPTSYSGLLAVISTLMQAGTQPPWPHLARIAAALPAMDWVAESGSSVVIRHDPYLYMRQGEAAWTDYPGGY